MVRPRKPGRPKGGKHSEFDAAEYLAELQAALPAKFIPPGQLQRYEAVSLLRDFVSLFQFRRGLAELRIQPSRRELERIANAFQQYLSSSGTSLDDAFGLKGGTRGRHSPKEQLAIRDRAIRALALYRDYLPEEQAKSSRARGEPSASERARNRVAKELGISPASVTSLRRRPKRL